MKPGVHEQRQTEERPAAKAAASAASFQRYTDRLVAKTLLWMFPRWIKPNHLTVLRFLLIPVILVLLDLRHAWWAFATFVVAVSTDFIDGAMARTRSQITTLGTYIDPLADKLLIAAVLAWIGWEFLVVQIILALIALELVLSAIGVGVLVRTGATRGANTFGKIKMILQSVALIVFLVAGFLDLGSLKTIAVYLLWAALALAVLSGGKQIYDFFTRRSCQDSDTSRSESSTATDA